MSALKYASRGFQAILQEDWKTVISAYTKAINGEPKHECVGAWYFEIGKPYEALGLTTAAVDAFSKYIHRHPDCRFGYASRAYLLQSLNDTCAANADFAQYASLRAQKEKKQAQPAPQSSTSWIQKQSWEKLERNNLQVHLMLAELEIRRLTTKIHALERTLTLVHRLRRMIKRQNNLLKTKLRELLQNPNPNQNHRCVICMDKERNLVFNPCSHVVCCSICSKSLKSCPICDRVIVSVQRVFLA